MISHIFHDIFKYTLLTIDAHRKANRLGVT